MRLVVDTNVCVVANGRNTNASVTCRLAAVEYLHILLRQGRTVLDLRGDIQAEYRRHLNPSGQPGVGDRFFQMILNSAPARVERVELKTNPNTGEYLDFPDDAALAKFDPSDRMFAAAARKAGVPVANAVDGGWLEHIAALCAAKISVQFVCGCDPANWFE